MEGQLVSANPGANAPATQPYSYWYFLDKLWSSAGPECSDKSDAKLWTHPIADVAFFTAGCVRAWFFTAKDGTLRKKTKKNTVVAQLRDHFASARGGALGNVVALAVFQPGSLTEFSGPPAVVPLDFAALHWLLDVNDAKRRIELRAITRYVPSGEREAVLRFDWRAHVCSFECRLSCYPLQAASVPLNQRLSTHCAALCHSQKAKHVPTSAVKQAATVCASLAALLLERREPEARRICADFKLLGGNRVVLIWAAAPSADATPFPAAGFPSSMPATSLPSDEADKEADATEGVPRGATSRVSSAASPRGATSRSSSAASPRGATSRASSAASPRGATSMASSAVSPRGATSRASSARNFRSKSPSGRVAGVDARVLPGGLCLLNSPKS
jgi:hypothetical protein